ncbi:MAG: acetyl/propionyl/methylcrotonyl-CoA carboxylase subunit alpha [Burkholderiales bacterium]
MFTKILIANRGEIACRVVRTARRLGIRTVAVYSEADAGALHVALADEAFCIGPAQARDSYLRAEGILDAARRSGAEAIHPGYGFLSENADFAEACERAGVVFIGPPAAAIRAMGSKAAAKTLMEKAGVPLVPGYHGDNQSGAVLRSEAGRIGFPVLIKASAGGGGKGMRAVERAADFDAALASCRREAKSAFGDEHVLLEKYLYRPRHVEVQVFADRHGACVHLFERDCSVQRRHQKIIEEAPAPGMNAKRRREMGAAALAAARAVGYVGAGTVEFIVDQAGAFHFMEMNTRLQVEHPVTEMITGLDLVEWQLRVAAGEKLPLAQDDLRIDGHAIEARIYAEDPGNHFLPATGRIVHLGLPAESRQVRIDTGVRAGDEITPYYDPMLAKLIVHGEDRGAALAGMRAALEEFEVAGIATNVPFLLRLVQCRAFAAADLDTGLIERHRDELLAAPAPAGEEALALATLAALLQLGSEAQRRALRSGDPHSPWHLADGWRLNQDNRHVFVFRDGERQSAMTVHYRDAGFDLELGGRRRALDGRVRDDGRLAATLDDIAVLGRVVRSGSRFDVFLPGQHHRLELHDPLIQELEAETHAGGLAAPMPGKIVAVLVEAGARVEKGTPLLILEAMKMEHTIMAPSHGRVAEIHYQVGDQVAEGAELLDFDPEPK